MNHQPPNPVFMLHCWHSQTLLLPTHGNHTAPKPFFMLHQTSFHASFLASQTFPTPLLRVIRNTRPRFHASFFAFPNRSHPTFVNHEAPKPIFMLHFEPSQTLPLPLLGTMKHATLFSCFSFGVPKPFPQHPSEPV